MRPVRETVLLFLMVHTVHSEAPESVFKPEGGVTEIGYCFGVDYITVFRSTLGGDQLLVNSSDEAVPHSPPGDLEGRIQFIHQLLGLEISPLRKSDSGLYRWECWKDKVLVSKYEQELLVCSREMSLVEISARPGGVIELKCNITGLEGKTIQWYHDAFLSDNWTMLIDTSVSLVPLQEELREVIGVKDGGVSLNVSGGMVTDNYYCLVMDGQSCVTFQNFYIVDIVITTLYTSVGETVVLLCPSEDKSQVKVWETPMGNVSSELVNSAMALSNDDNFSLVVNVLSANFAGEYKCSSASLRLAEYALFLCPSGEPKVKQFSEGDDAILECSKGKEDSHSVQWYRRRPLEEEQPILHSKDQNITVPTDLKGRVVLSKQDHSLQLSDLNKGDSGEFWCVVLSDLDNYEDDYTESEEGNDVEYNDNGDQEDDEDDKSTDNIYENGNRDSKWVGKNYTETCISKQVTSLRERTEKRGRGTGPNTPLEPESQPGSESSSMAVAVCGTLAGIVLVAAITAVIVVSQRRSTDTADGEAMRDRKKVDEEQKLNPKVEVA